MIRSASGGTLPVASSLRPRTRQAAALSILAFFIWLGWVILVAPLWSAWADRADQADRLTELIFRLKRTAAEAPALRAALAMMGHDQQNKAAIFAAPNPVLAAAALQAELTRIAESEGAQLRSVQQLPPTQEDALSRIGVRAELQGDTTQLSQLLYDIETHAPIMMVRSVSVRGSEQPNQSAGQRSPLLIQIEIIAYAGAGE